MKSFCAALVLVSCATFTVPFKDICELLRLPSIYNAYHHYYLKKHTAALGDEDADQWRTDLVKKTLQALGVTNTNTVAIKKLSSAAWKELHATGYCTITGIWLYHSPYMSKEMAHYIAVHEAVHYAMKHPQRKFCINTLNDAVPVISACIGALAGVACKQLLQPCSALKIKCIAIASTLFINDLLMYHAHRIKLNSSTSIEEEADKAACAHIMNQGNQHILDYIITNSERRSKAVEHIQEKAAAYTTTLYKQHKLDPIWLASLHTTTIKNARHHTKI
ncbi:hypothetical protein Noda2021_08880 [Candidatus Dependentiae bacterium Noda2021]|nr:hypothetical protein Noda2021_08880 [Candidatus Dependentiae bacterium Noda2021]